MKNIAQSLNDYEKEERFLSSLLFSGKDYIESISFTEGRVCYDLLITLKNTKQLIGEVKVRSFAINKYNEYILEKQKVNSLFKEYKLHNYEKILYINFFKNSNKNIRDCIVFNLSERIKIWQHQPPNIINMWMNEATFKSNTKKVQKEVIMLKYDPNIDVTGCVYLN